MSHKQIVGSALDSYSDGLVFGGYRHEHADDVGGHLNSVANLTINLDSHKEK